MTGFYVQLVRHKRGGCVHREDCSGRGRSLNYEDWEGAFWTEGLIRGIDAAEGFRDRLIDRAIEDGLRFCLRCLPDLDMDLFRVRTQRRAARDAGVTV